MVLFVINVSGFENWAVIVPLAAVAVSLIYFLLSQRLEETRLFKDLFSEFNLRYDALNATLQNAKHHPPEERLPAEIHEALVDYFNLCAEEYIFYKLGYIRQEVWQAWLKGMRYYYEDGRIRELWDRELKQDSYYGFTNEHLRRKN